MVCDNMQAAHLRKSQCIHRAWKNGWESNGWVVGRGFECVFKTVMSCVVYFTVHVGIWK